MLQTSSVNLIGLVVTMRRCSVILRPLSLAFAAAWCLHTGAGAGGGQAATAPPRVAQARVPTPAHRTWRDYGGSADSAKYVDFTQITKANVANLQVAWTYFNGSAMFNPIVVDTVMYVMARNNSLAAIDATTGKEIWIHAGLAGIATRGINYWESADRRDRRLIFQINGNLQEIDARTGRSILTFGRNGLVDLRAGLGRDVNTVARIQSGTPGRVFGNLVIVGSSTGENFLAPPGHIRAYDVITGKMVWIFHTIPQPGEFGYDTWPKDAWKYAGGTNAWGEMSLDVARGIVYIPLGSATYDMYGADRLGTNLFANCLLALDARTGKRVWHFQTVHHDLWDYDLTAAPQLITIRHNGRIVDAIAQSSKHGFMFVFDRVTGRPIWPIEERPVPKSDVPGEQAWPTQPFPTVVPPFARQAMTVADVNPFLPPAERAEWTSRIAKARNEGLFTPPAFQRETVQIPGARGGSNFGTTAADPEKGLVYLITQDWPSLVNIEGTETSVGRGARGAAPAVDPGQAELGRGGRGAASEPGQAAYQQHCQTCHGADRTGTPTGPTLAGLGGRLDAAGFRQLVLTGRGQMPANTALDTAALTTLYGLITGGAGAGGRGRGALAPAPMSGPVVATGGAPGGLEVRLNEAQMRAQVGGGNRFVGPDYPAGVIAPTVRLYSEYGLNFPFIIGPPWSSLVAYDLNTGTIKWKRPLGEDPLAMSQGGKDTGVLQGGERRGIIVTATGMLFVNGPDGKLRAYDAETGAVLWTHTLPGGTQGIPAMYELNGSQYLVVTASAAPSFGRTTGGRGGGATGGADQTGYIAFALPR